MEELYLKAFNLEGITTAFWIFLLWSYKGARNGVNQLQETLLLYAISGTYLWI